MRTIVLWLIGSMGILFFVCVEQASAQENVHGAEIRLSMKDPRFPNLDLKGQLRLEVLKGEAKLTSGATLLTGSDIRASETWIVFQPGMVIRAGHGGTKLKGAVYSEGTTLIVEKDGKFRKIE